MQRTTKQQTSERSHVLDFCTYEPPQMRIVPVRGYTVIAASEGVNRETGSMDNLLNAGLRDFYYHGQYGTSGNPGNTATEWESDWNLTFGD